MSCKKGDWAVERGKREGRGRGRYGDVRMEIIKGTGEREQAHRQMHCKTHMLLWDPVWA